MKQSNKTHRMRRISNGIFYATVITGIISLGAWLAVRSTAAELEWPRTKFFTDAETDMVAKTVWGEARGCSDIQKEAVAWCVLNRVDDDRFPDCIADVITQPNEFFGYSESNPVDEDIRKLTKKVMIVWATEEMMPADGRERVLPREYVFFSGDGVENTFTTKWLSGVVWDWSGVTDDR